MTARQNGNSPWGGLDLVEGFALAQAVEALHREGILADLSEWRSAAQLAAPRDLDESTLSALLNYTATRTDVLGKQGDRYRLSRAYRNSTWLGQLLDQYVGAYGPNLGNLSAILREPREGRKLVDRKRHADAFRQARMSGFPEVVRIIEKCGFSRVLDIGCGNAGLLASLATAYLEFEGWGIDASADMCRVARQKIAAEGIADRVHVLQGDAWTCGEILEPALRREIQAVVACSLLNEFFLGGDEPAIEWLKSIAELFDDRILVVADYYGRLGRPGDDAAGHVLLHDFVQSISGQGIPPGDVSGWGRIYAAAGCRLSQAFDLGSDVPRFVHIVVL